MRLRRDEGSRAATTSAVASVGAVLSCAGALWAHAVVHPAMSTTRAYETYTLRVPNEKDVPTTRVEIEFPAEVFVVSFAEVTGWELNVERDESGRAVAATWSGELPPHRFVELPFVAVNPAEPTTLVWSVVQVYEGPAGEEAVSWSGPADSEFPASRTVVTAGDAAADEGAVRLPLATFAALAASLLALLLAIVALRARSA